MSSTRNPHTWAPGLVLSLPSHVTQPSHFPSGPGFFRDTLCTVYFMTHEEQMRAWTGKPFVAITCHPNMGATDVIRELPLGPPLHLSYIPCISFFLFFLCQTHAKSQNYNFLFPSCQNYQKNTPFTEPSLLQHVVMMHLLCPRHLARWWEYSGDEDR